LLLGIWLEVKGLEGGGVDREGLKILDSRIIRRLSLASESSIVIWIRGI